MEFYVKKLISNQLECALGDSIRVQVNDFIKKEIVPEVIEDLKKNKDKIINQFKDSIMEMMSELAKSMVAIVVKNMEKQYTVKDIVGLLKTYAKSI